MQFEATKKPVYAIGAEGLKGSQPLPKQHALHSVKLKLVSPLDFQA